ncbi:MAG: addiction module toxin RelE [Methanomicrobium sp.]|nr:addiction module toxin RelE [Methanomicrobium sp.]
MSEKAERYLAKNKSIKNTILKKIRYCLEDHLFDTLNECDKHELKGNLKGLWRLKLPYRKVVVYEPVGIRPYRHARIYFIKTEEEYHNWLNSA